MSAKSVRPVTNVSAAVFVAAVLAQANKADGCIDNLAKELGLTPKSAYARYAKYRKEMKAKTGTELPKLSQSVERKATLDWSELAKMVNPQAGSESNEGSTDSDTESTANDEAGDSVVAGGFAENTEAELQEIQA